MQCPSCTTDNQTEARFCSRCGTRLTPVPAPVLDGAALRQHLASGRYAAVLAQAAPDAPADLAVLATEARSSFEQSIAAMLAIYQERYPGQAPNTRRISDLQAVYRERLPVAAALDDPFEVDAYVQALIDQARRAPDREQARQALYVAQVLQSPQHEAQIAELLAALAGPAPVAAPAIRRTTLLSDSHDQPNGLSSHSAVPHNGAGHQPATQPSPPPPPEPQESDLVLAALELLEQLIAEQADMAQIDRQLETAQALIGADSPYQRRLQRAQTQSQALRHDLPQLEALLKRPLAEWLAGDSGLSIQADTFLERLTSTFDSDTPLVERSRAQVRQRQEEVARLRGQVDALAALEGPALLEQMRALEHIRSADLPQLDAARRRASQYRAQQEAEHQREQARQVRVKQQEDNRLLRRRLDDAYRDLAPSSEDLILLRNEAALSAQLDLPPEDLLLDPQSFAYYDLLLASRHRSLTRPNAQVEQGQTLTGMGDYAQAYKILKAAFADAQQGDDKDALIGVKNAYEEAREALLQHLADDVTATLAGAEGLLKRFDYQAARQNLQALRRRIDDTEIEIDETLERQLAKTEADVAVLAERDKQAHSLLDGAEQSMADPENPDFPGALAALDQAAQQAPWLQTEIEHRRGQLRDRQRMFVVTRIQRAGIVRQGGAEDDFQQAEHLLSQAEAHISEPAQHEDIAKLRAAIAQQRHNLQRLDEIRTRARNLAEQARKGLDLDLTGAQIIAERERIGPAQAPNLEPGDWAEISSYLTAAEQRIAIWHDFFSLVSRAEQAAFLDDPAQMNGLLHQLVEFSEHSYLPVQDHLRRIKMVARQGTKIEKVRRLIDELRTDLADNDTSVTAERIFRIIGLAHGLDDAEITSERDLLKELLPLYQARDNLQGALSHNDFAGFETLYAKLPADLQSNPTISKLKQQADIAHTLATFTQTYQSLLREIRPLFNDGWEKPQEFQHAVDRIRSFAEALAPRQREQQAQLDANTIDQLDGLATMLGNARADYDHFRFQDAQARVQTLIQEIPTSAVSAQNLLGPYTSELAFLRTQLSNVKQTLTQRLIDEAEEQTKFQSALAQYHQAVGDERLAFRKNELFQIQTSFAELQAPAYRERCVRHIAAIKQITDLIDQVDAAEEIIISGQTLLDSTASTESIRGGANRRKRVEAYLAQIQQQSQAIRNTPEGMHWRGIQDDQRFQTLRASLDLARALGDSEDWLARAGHSGQKLAALENLRGEAAQLNPLELSGSRRGDLQQAGLARLAETCEQRWSEVAMRLRQVNQIITQQRQRRRRQITAGAALLVVAGLGLGGWQVPPVREQVTVALVGTLTPVPPPTAVPTQGLGGLQPTLPPTPVPTTTPVPTATPVPPQQGLIVYPGRVNVRRSPSVEADRVGVVQANDDVSVTGFTTAPDGTGWYRLNVPKRNLLNVWILMRVTENKQANDTVRILDGQALNPALALPYAP